MSYKNANGNASATGMAKTPPTRVVPTAPDAVSSVRNPILPGGYGQNQYEGPSSAEVSKVPISGLAANLKASGDDGTLDDIIKSGASGDDDWQTRKVSAAPLPPAHGMHKNTTGSPSGVVPPVTGYVEKPADAYGPKKGA